MATTQIPGYSYGAVGPSPVGEEEVGALVGAVGLTEADHEALRELWAVLDGSLEALFEAFIERIAHFFVPTFGRDGVTDEAYMAAAHPRFLRWIEDTCLRPYDREWADYHHEIGLRHHRTKKNQTDGATAVDVVPFRYLPVTVAPMTIALREFIEARDVAPAQATRFADAWMKSLLLQVALWSRAYVADADW